MAQGYWPFNAVDTTETQFSSWARRLQMDGVWGEPGDNVLKLNQGSGLTATLAGAPGYVAFVRGHMYENDSDLSVVFSAGSTNPRIDRLVLRLNPTDNTITPTIIQGTPAASSPAVPDLTQTDAANYDIPIAQIYRAANSSSVVTADITDERLFAGMVLGLWTTATRPGTAKSGRATARKGQVGYNTTTSKYEFWDGAAWVDLNPTSFDASAVTSGTLNAARIPSLDASKITTGTLSDARLPTVPVTKGGTGATSAAAALTALGAAAAAHSHSAADITSGTLSDARLPTVPVSKGGTGSTTKSGGRNGLGIYVQSGTPSGAASGDLWFW